MVPFDVVSALLSVLEDRGVLQLPYVYRITKHDPADRDERWHYADSEDICDHGEVEAADLQAVAAVTGETDIDQLAIREPPGNPENAQ